jgi:hypothetical protein
MRLTALSFEEWVRHLFDHPGGGPQWWADVEAPFWAGPPAVTVAYVTRLFEEPVGMLARYDDAQLGQGFWYLVSNGASDCMFALSDGTVRLDDRLRAVRAFTNVFRSIFAERCSPHLSHCDEPGASPLNVTCYMWWDLLPLAGAPDDPAARPLGMAALDVMRDVLALDSIACQESALHGLGHWHAGHPREVEGIVDAFLARATDARPALVGYARSARSGCVL